MGIADNLVNNVQAWGTLAIVIVIVSIVLTKFKDNSAMTAELNSTVDTFVAALAEPKNWVAIVIIALIGFSMLKLFRNKK